VLVRASFAAQLLAFERGGDQWCCGGGDELDQLWVHELVLIGYVEHVDFFVAQVLAEFCGEAGFVFFFHCEDEVGPCDVRQSDAALGGAAGACGASVDAVLLEPDALSSGRTPLVAAADEEEVHCVVSVMIRSSGTS